MVNVCSILSLVLPLFVGDDKEVIEEEEVDRSKFESDAEERTPLGQLM